MTRRAGKDLTIVGLSSMVPPALQAADELAGQGIDVEVIDLRSLMPLDLNAVIASVRKTGRLVVVEPGWRMYGAAAEIIAGVVEALGPQMKSAPRASDVAARLCRRKPRAGRGLGVGPEDAGRLARLCLERGAIDLDLAPVLADQRAAIARQRVDLDRLEGELLDLELTVAAAARASRTRTGRTRPAARKDRPVPTSPIRVLFVCTHNSARSQIAEALLQRYGGVDFDVHSAGTEATRVNPYALRILAELGIDWSGARSKVIDEFLDQSFDYVITVCDRAKATCPVFPGSANSLHWGLDDPSEVEGTDEEKLTAFRRTEVEISARLRPFVEIALRAAGRERGAIAAAGHGHGAVDGD